MTFEDTMRFKLVSNVRDKAFYKALAQVHFDLWYKSGIEGSLEIESNPASNQTTDI